MHKVLVLFILLFSSLNILQAQKAISAKLFTNEAENISRPQFPGGEEKFHEYLSDNIKYPPVLIKIKLEGSIDLRFTIDKEGKLKNIEITSGFDPDADDEVLRVMQTMPQWIPAKENGENIDFTYTLTVTFTLTEELIAESKKPIEKTEPNASKSKIEQKEQPQIAEQEYEREIRIIKTDSLNYEPQFPGGQEALDAYFKKNLKYPKRAIEYGIEGRVVFTLEISPKGKITNIWLYKGLFYECNEEAFYLIKKMPNWIPGLKDGKPVSMRVTIPIPFVLPQKQ